MDLIDKYLGEGKSLPDKHQLNKWSAKMLKQKFGYTDAQIKKLKKSDQKIKK